MKEFAIGIPTVNRYDLLLGSLRRYEKNLPNSLIYVYDNGQQNIKSTTNATIISSEKNIGVAASWNRLCENIFGSGFDYAIILNDDIYLDRHEVEINNYLTEKGDQPWFFLSTFGWCSFMISAEIFETVGEFDERFFPAYFEDNDYSRRLTLAGVNVHHDSFFSPLVHRNSSSIEKNPSLNNGWKPNQNYYIEKWGGVPGKETFTVPFNGLKK